MALDWKDEPRVTHRSFRIVDLVGLDSLITRRIFEDCTIYGPAVLVPLGSSMFEKNIFEGEPQALLWEIPEDRTQVEGAIGLVDCTFRRCIFRRIGIAGPRTVIDLFRQGSQQ